MIIAHPVPPPQVYQQHPVHAKKKPPVISYVGGEHPHMTVRLAFEDNVYVSIRRAAGSRCAGAKTRARKTAARCR